MNPAQFAAKFCCNNMSGSCIGVGWQIQPNGYFKPIPLPTMNKPCIVGSGTRCPFFEKCVLPIARQDCPSLEKEGRLQAEKLYWRQSEPAHKLRTRSGKCGHPVLGRQRYCPNCLKLRQLAAKRLHHRRNRHLPLNGDKLPS